MYRAKVQRNAYMFFSRKTQQQAVDRRGSAQDLHRALERRELVLRYQPCVELATRRLVGGETVAHWNRRVGGVIAQPELIRLAQRAGLLTPVTEWLLQTACADACAWQSRGATPIRVAVPVSRQQFVQDSFVETVHRAFRESGLEPRCLDLELDEGIFMLEAEKTADKLRALGLAVSIADFGNGYSPLADLKKYAIWGLRIGRDLIGRLTTDHHRAATVRGIIAMARELDLSVVADGVENEAQAAWLQNHGCDMIQGNLVAEALSAEALAHMIDRVPGSEGQAA
jgi:EAL domain-containing protein (putative c-di-GMP-specific phosphodiesterase class I)